MTKKASTNEQTETVQTEAAAAQVDSQEVTLAALTSLPSNLPDIEKAESSGVSLVSNYWGTDDKEPGAKFRAWFNGLRPRTTVDPDSGEEKSSLTAFFFVREHGNVSQICNSSARLVGAFQDMGENVRPGMAFEITYKGKRKNATNQFKSDDWDVVPIPSANLPQV